MTEQELIFKLFFEEHLKQKEIATIINKSATHISDVLKTNPKTKEEKKLRHEQSQERKKQYNKAYYTTYNRPKKDDDSYQQLQALLKQDVNELSYHDAYNMSDYDYAKWNPSAYTRNSKGNLALVKGLKVGSDVPKLINMNIKIPTQKFKNRCCMSH